MTFWIGLWDVYRGDRRVGRQDVRQEIDGCALHVEWSGPDGDRGLGVIYLDPADGSWRQLWLTNQVPFASRPKVRVQDATYTGPGVRFAWSDTSNPARGDRTTIAPLSGGRVRQLLEATRDGGATWTTVFDITHRKRRGNLDAS